MRRGFSLIQALAIILLVSFLLMVTLKQASIVAKHTGDSYAYQRAELFSNSAVEMAMLAIHGHDRSGGNCLENTTITDEQFEAEVQVLQYYLHEDEPDKCSDADLFKEIDTEASNGMVWMKITVKPKGRFANNSDRNITLERTTLQKL